MAKLVLEYCRGDSNIYFPISIKENECYPSPMSHIQQNNLRTIVDESYQSKNIVLYTTIYKQCLFCFGSCCDHL